MPEGLKCDEIRKILAKYQKERGQLAKLSRAAGVSAPVLGRIASGKQKALSVESWLRLHRYDPEVFPPPPMINSVNTKHGKGFSAKAMEMYPRIERIIDHANESAEADLPWAVFLELCINSLKNEKLKIKKRTS
ncbi:MULTISPECIES: hypothetical protein [Desulfococcus]|jgi:hypothetical protein|uniref:HTH cro/C1-type domain-containing protein n=1 Tax=Desulfococcus multivorans DSM 2059 TaxID=1121405 RepID=S7U349_DESML|nr:hypothetical protein [Desulfococcus multivorans]AOY57199.1 uncharacterized protein Dmul_04240 [Desulfococcus multivorans]AQU99669.1 hypothetical protein B2D07_01970 [Desulfococcus multivorans]EPR43410.1 hypothetical protein dsmv_1201 [Desulfococcus multivorans DSM 2059]MDX9819635.1 hypothetical protein [Desulfococcus multivorans]SKA25639.1 hypothetical protein SAMN02745446_03562 [Desulfococcus multivorans DSM 2059]